VAGELGQPPAHRVADGLRDAQARAEALPRTGATPSDALLTRDWSSAPAPGEQAAVISPASRSDGRPSGRCTTPALPRCRGRSDAGDGGSVRRGTAAPCGGGRRTGQAGRRCRPGTPLGTPYRDPPSAGPPRRPPAHSPRRRKSRSTAPPDRLQVHAAAQVGPLGRRPPLPAAGRSDAAAMAPARDHRPADVSAATASKASVTGRYGAPAEVGTARPIPTGTCRPAAIRASSRIRRDLPMPGLTRDDDAAATARQRSGKGRLQRLDLRPPPHQDRAQHLAHDPSLPHRRQSRSMITRPTPAGLPPPPRNCTASSGTTSS
jgi:hypothetical protein